MDGEREEIDIASIFVFEVPIAAAIKVELLRRLVDADTSVSI